MATRLGRRAVLHRIAAALAVAGVGAGAVIQRGAARVVQEAPRFIYDPETKRMTERGIDGIYRFMQGLR